MLPSRIVAAFAVMLLSSSALAAEGGATPDGVSVVIELIRSLGLPTAFLLFVAWYHVREMRRKEDTWAKERTALLEQIASAHKETVALNRETVEALNSAENTARSWETIVKEARGGGTGRKL